MEVCITGGIACGKTTAGAYFAQQGFAVLEADDICRGLMRAGRTVFRAVAAEFGPDIIGQDGEIDRAALGRLVFGDARQLARLNALTHPPARAEINRRRRTRTGPLAVIVPLAYEAGWAADWPVMICVGAPAALQLERLQARGLTPAEARARLAAQMPVEEKMRRADYVIYNSGAPAVLQRQVDMILKRLHFGKHTKQE